MFIRFIGIAATLATLATTAVVNYEAANAYLDAAVRCVAPASCPGDSIGRSRMASNGVAGSAAWLQRRNQVV